MTTATPKKPLGRKEAEMLRDRKSSGSLTQQNFRDDVNINKMIARYRKGETPLGNTHKPLYGDFTNHQDFHAMQNKIAQANQDFMQLPANVRKRFANSPEKLIEFISDAKNKDEAIELGIIPKPVEQPKTEPVEVIVKNSPDAEASGAPPA